MKRNWYWHKLTEKGEICILRMFGDSPEIEVPECILGRKVTQLGAYCFAKTGRAKDYQICSDFCEGDQAGKEFAVLYARGELKELCGEYLQKVILPKTLESIGDFCFYQCTALSELTVGNCLTEIGGDAFMNCQRLKTITILGSVGSPSGLKQILRQRFLKTQAVFRSEGKTEAVLVYPEYSESYHEVGPAHIFALAIEGEGFRARQCFSGGVVLLPQYDAVFCQACVAESEETLCEMALMRLYYPAGLQKQHREAYEGYLRSHAVQAATWLIRRRDLSMLSFLGDQGYFKEHKVEEITALALSADWTEGAGVFLRQNQWFARRENAYSFDDF